MKVLNKNRVKILSLIIDNNGITMQQLQEIMNMKRTTLNYNINILLTNNLIYTKVQHSSDHKKRYFPKPKAFEDDIQKIMGEIRYDDNDRSITTSCHHKKEQKDTHNDLQDNNQQDILIRSHNIHYKIGYYKRSLNIKKAEQELGFSLKDHMKNWQVHLVGLQLRVTVGSVQVQITPSNIIFHCEHIYCEDPNIAMLVGVQAVLESLARIKDRLPGLETDDKIIPFKQDHAIIKDPIAVWFEQHGVNQFKVKDKDGNVRWQYDRSLVDPELEATHGKKAQDDMSNYADLMRNIPNWKEFLLEVGEGNIRVMDLAQVKTTNELVKMFALFIAQSQEKDQELEKQRITNEKILGTLMNGQVQAMRNINEQMKDRNERDELLIRLLRKLDKEEEQEEVKVGEAPRDMYQ